MNQLSKGWLNHPVVVSRGWLLGHSAWLAISLLDWGGTLMSFAHDNHMPLCIPGPPSMSCSSSTWAGAMEVRLHKGSDVVGSKCPLSRLPRHCPGSFPTVGHSGVG